MIKLFDIDDFWEEYAEYIMAHSSSDKMICNGDMLTKAMEESYLLDEFKTSLIGIVKSATKEDNMYDV